MTPEEQDAAIRAYLARIPGERPSDGRSGAAWGGKFTFGKGDRPKGQKRGSE